MPPASPRRQPERPADAWFRRDLTQRMVHEVQRQTVPELTRVFGASGLYLRPSTAVPSALSGNLLGEVVSLVRDGDGFAGDLACRDDALPVATGTLSLVYALFVFETSPAPQALLEEIARVLKPEGVAILATLNPLSLARLRWAFRGLAATDPAVFAGRVRDAGLDVQRSRYVGPVWSPPDHVDVVLQRGDGPASRLRMAHLTIARRRDPGVTPLRAGSPSLAFRPGMSAG
jgi:SAM-dependent methyltransferase